MEDASKALLIAGAVLIILIVIGLAVVFIVKSEVLTQMFSDDLSEQEIAEHNAVFSVYDGQISGTELISLLLTAEANNAKNKIHINIDVKASTGITGTDAGARISTINKTRIYTSKIIYDGKGIISKIEIS